MLANAINTNNIGLVKAILANENIDLNEKRYIDNIFTFKCEIFHKKIIKYLNNQFKIA